MAKCKLDITLEGNKTHFKVGDTVSGRVNVSVDAECKCDNLFIEKFWQTHGRGNKNKGKAEKVVLYQGTWQPGEYQYDFEFEFLDEPISYKGKHINIDWYLKARADIPWALDPKAEQDIVLVANPEKNARSAPTDNEVLTRDEALAVLKDNTKAKAIIGLLGVLFLIAPVYFAYTGWRNNDYFMLIFAIIFVGSALPFAWKLLKPLVAQKKLGKVVYELSETACSAGESVDIKVSFSPPNDITINDVKAKLVMTEKAVSGSGTNRTTHSHVYQHGEKLISGQSLLRARTSFEKTVSLSFPKSVMHTFHAGDNSLSWSIVLEIDVPNWPDWSRSSHICVTS